MIEKNNKKLLGKASSDLTFSILINSDSENDNKARKMPTYGKSKFMRAISNFNTSKIN